MPSWIRWAWLEHAGGAAEVGYVPVDSTGRSRSIRSHGHGRYANRARFSDVGEQSGRHAAASPPDRHDRQRTRRTVTQRRRPGRRPRRARLRGERARPVELHRTQAWWTVRDRWPCWPVAIFGRPPILHGGGQERDVRSGTLDVAATAGFAAALEVATQKTGGGGGTDKSSSRTELVNAVLAAVPWAVGYGPTAKGDRLPGIANIGFPGCSADAILMLLDSRGIDCATGRGVLSGGYRSRATRRSAMGYSDAGARSVLRFSLGHSSTPARRTGARERAARSRPGGARAAAAFA